MIRLGYNKINKIGNSNKLYFGNGMVYQSYSIITADSPDVELTLPDVPFMFNFNAKNYSNGVLYNVDGALFDKQIKLEETSYITQYNDHLYINGNSHFTKVYDTNSDNPFNRSNGQPLTIIAKTKPNEGSVQHLFANRGDDAGYNFMLRNGYTNAWLHTRTGSESSAIRVPLDFSQPNIYSIRCASDNYGIAENYTTGVRGNKTSVNWGGQSYGVNLFMGGIDFSTETFFGDFYWIYCSLEELTDEQILQVISYNEGMSFEPVLPEEPEEPKEEVLEVEFTKAVKNGGNNDMYIYLYNEDESVQVCLNLFGLNTSNNNENYIPRNDYYVRNNKGYGYIYGGGYSWIKINSVQTNITEDSDTYVTVEHIGTNYKLTFNRISFGNILLDGSTFYGPIEGLIIP